MQTLSAPSPSAYLPGYPGPDSEESPAPPPQQSAASPEAPDTGAALPPFSPTLTPAPPGNSSGDEALSVDGPGQVSGRREVEPSDGGVATEAIVGIVVAALAAVCVALLIAGLYIRRRRQRGEDQQGSGPGVAMVRCQSQVAAMIFDWCAIRASWTLMSPPVSTSEGCVARFIPAQSAPKQTPHMHDHY